MKEIINNKILDNLSFNTLIPIKCVELNMFDLSYLDFEHNKENNDEILSLKVFKKTHENIKHKVSAFSNSYLKYDLKKLHDIDLELMLNDTLINETVFLLNKEFLQNIYKLSNLTYKKTFNKIDKFFEFLYKLFNKEYTKQIKLKNNQDLIRKILGESNKIAQYSRFGPADFIIVNSKTSLLLQESNFCIYNKDDNKVINSNRNIYKIGKLANLEVFVDPYMEYNDNSIYIGRKIKENQPGIYFSYNLNDTVIYKDLSFDNYSETNILETSSNFIELGNNPENNYSKIVYKLKK